MLLLTHFSGFPPRNFSYPTSTTNGDSGLRLRQHPSHLKSKQTTKTNRRNQASVREGIRAPKGKVVPIDSREDTTSVPSCIICTETFSSSIKPPDRISSACLHQPSVCKLCVAKSIKNDLENKIWNQIKCPECGILLEHQDISRLADAKTFARYVVILIRFILS